MEIDDNREAIAKLNGNGKEEKMKNKNKNQIRYRRTKEIENG